MEEELWRGVGEERPQLAGIPGLGIRAGGRCADPRGACAAALVPAFPLLSLVLRLVFLTG